MLNIEQFWRELFYKKMSRFDYERTSLLSRRPGLSAIEPEPFGVSAEQGVWKWSGSEDSQPLRTKAKQTDGRREDYLGEQFERAAVDFASDVVGGWAGAISAPIEILTNLDKMEDAAAVGIEKATDFGKEVAGTLKDLGGSMIDAEKDFKDQLVQMVPDSDPSDPSSSENAPPAAASTINNSDEASMSWIS